MALLLFGLLAAFAVAAFFAGGKNLISPWFLLCAVCLATYFIVLLNYTNWNAHINSTLILYLCSAILAFGVGTALINLTYGRKEATAARTDGADLNRPYPVNIFLAATLLLSAAYLTKLIFDAGGASSFSALLKSIYENKISGNYSPGFLFNQMSEIIRAVAYLNTFRLFAQIFEKRYKISVVKLIIPIILFTLTTLFATDRNVFLRYGIYFICLWIIFYYRHCKKQNVNARIICYILVMSAVLLLVFFAMGKLKQYKSGLFRALSIYGGSGLYNLNLWLESFDGQLMYGRSTFSQFVNTLGTLLKPFGVNLKGSVSSFDQMISYTSPNGYVYSSNIYSALRPYVEDFGYWGTVIFPFAAGAFYQWLFLKTKRSGCGFALIAYCLLIYPVIFFPIAEQLFRRFHLGFIYETGWVAILYFAVYGKRFKRVAQRYQPKLNGVKKWRKKK